MLTKTMEARLGAGRDTCARLDPARLAMTRGIMAILDDGQTQPAAAATERAGLAGSRAAASLPMCGPAKAAPPCSSRSTFSCSSPLLLIKPLREALILSGEGAEVKSYAAAGQAILLLGLVPAYGALADRLPRRGLLNAVTAFFVLCLVAFFALTQAACRRGQWCSSSGLASST